MDLRTRWQQIDLQTIQDWLISGEQEDLHFDCKLLSSATFDRNDRKTFAVAVSGFANSDGGILMWGVDARKDQRTGIDSVVALVPLPTPESVRATLNGFSGTAASPIVDGIEHRAILDGTGTAGFVATLVPASEYPPHMAKLGENRYYKRSGDSFYQMEHFDLADMFGRRAKPVLEVVLVDRVGSYANENSGTYEPVLAIKNVGRAAARFPFLRVSPSPPFGLNREYGLRNGETGLPERPQFGLRESAIFGGGVDHVIHPGTTLDVQRIRAPRGVSLQSTTMESLTIDFEVACEGIALQTGRIERTGAEIVEFVQRDIREKYPPQG